MDEANVPGSVPPEPASGFETLLWDLFLRLMDVPGDRVEEEILSAQRRLCQALALDRSVLWQIHPDHSTRLCVTHVYDAAHDSPDAASVDGSILRGRDREFLVSDNSITKHADASDYFPWLAERLVDGESVVHMSHASGRRVGLWALALMLLTAVFDARAQDAAKPPAGEPKPTMTVYGSAMIDFGYNFTQIDPDWYDTMKVTKLPSYTDQFGKDNSVFAGVRQTRFGVKASVPTTMGDLLSKFEIDMFGTGGDAGQTTIRLRHAWGELGAFGAGQTDSPFEDPDLWPNTLEYWGPTGMVFFRNVQVRWTPVRGEKTFMLALERPGASGDAGVLADRIELQNIKARFPLPDLTGAFRFGQKWGYVRVGGALRKINWDDMLDDQYDLSGGTTGWGLNFSSSLNVGENDVLRLQYAYGRGIENYM
jgi:hypothetical protein